MVLLRQHGKIDVDSVTDGQERTVLASSSDEVLDEFDRGLSSPCSRVGAVFDVEVGDFLVTR